MDWRQVVSEELQLSQLQALLFTAPAKAIQESLNAHRGEPAASSPAAAENASFDGGELANAVTFAGLWLTDVCGQYFDVLDGILSNSTARRIGPRPVVRAIVEHAAMAAWLLEPAIGAEARAARGLLAEAISADSMLQAMKHEGGTALADARERSENVSARIQHCFPGGVQTARKSPQRYSAWKLGEETYGTLTLHIENLVRRRRGTSRGRVMYMFTSLTTHPSPAGALMHAVRQPDGSLTFPQQDVRVLGGSVMSAMAAWSWAVDDLLTLYGWECPAFRQWEEFLPADAMSVPPEH